MIDLWFARCLELQEATGRISGRSSVAMDEGQERDSNTEIDLQFLHSGRSCLMPHSHIVLWLVMRFPCTAVHYCGHK